MAFFKIYVTCSRREPDIDSHLKFTRKCGFKSDDRNSLTIHLVVSDSCGHIFLFSKNDEKMCHLLHFLLHLKIKLDTIEVIILFEKEWKWVTWYFIPNCSKWFMCISWDSRFKQLLNFRAYTEIKCTTLVTVAFFWI